MSVLIVCNHKDPQPWAEALQTALPQTKIEIYPELADPLEVQFLLCWKPQPHLFDQFPNLKVVQSLGAGVDHIFDTQKLSERILVARIVDPRLSSDMWEFLLALVMNQLRQLSLYQQQQKQELWLPHAYQSIAETCISILGLGQIGRKVAQNFAQLGFRVQGWSNTPKSIPGVDCLVGSEVLPTLLSNTDILINLLPLTPQTTGLLNRKNLDLLKPAAFLINVGRGGHLVEEDLLELLAAGRLGGAALDVIAKEPLPKDHPFWQHPKILLTPHIASTTNIATAVGQIVENYRRFLAGKPLLNQVSVLRGY